MLRPLHVTLTGLALVGFASVSACDTPDPGKTGPIASSSAAVTAAPPPPAPVVPKETVAKIVNQWGKSTGLKSPEGLLYDDKNDIYLVSNVDGRPLDVDGKGFISKLAPVGQGVELKWIESGKNKVVLNAPKGMAITGDTLWVADIDTVRSFNRSTGAPTGDVKIPGATFLNDLAADADGRVFVSDTGFRMAKDGGLQSSGTDAVYAIEKDRKLTTVAKGKSLGGPNGIIPYGDHRIYVVTMRSGELFSLDGKGRGNDAGAEPQDLQRLPKGTLDGIVFAGGEYYVSSWDASAVYRGKVGKAFTPFIEDVKSPADIVFDRKRNRIIVPLMGEDEVRAYELP